MRLDNESLHAAASQFLPGSSCQAAGAQFSADVSRQISLGRRSFAPPCVVGVVDRILTPASLASLKAAGLGILEIRFDLFEEEFSRVLDFVREASLLFGIIGTIRENEANKAALSERYAALCPIVDAVDIEVGTQEAARGEFIRIVKNSGKLLMVSHHDFQATPPEAELLRFIAEAGRLSADFLKLAVFAKTIEDAADLMRFMDQQSRAGQKLLSAFSMGPHGAITRISAGLHGSVFTYGYIHESTAPGQLSVSELLRLTSLFYPEAG